MHTLKENGVCPLPKDLQVVVRCVIHCIWKPRVGAGFDCGVFVVISHLCVLKGLIVAVGERGHSGLTRQGSSSHRIVGDVFGEWESVFRVNKGKRIVKVLKGLVGNLTPETY